MFYKLFILMILCHVIDDFVLQPVCLSKLKQKDWWLEQDGFNSSYKNDYQMALAMHCLSWSAMIHLPIMFFLDCSGLAIFISFVLNSFVHYIVDDMKTNEKKINLVVDQTIHVVQIFLTLISLI